MHDGLALVQAVDVPATDVRAKLVAVAAWLAIDITAAAVCVAAKPVLMATVVAVPASCVLIA